MVSYQFQSSALKLTIQRNLRLQYMFASVLVPVCSHVDPAVDSGLVSGGEPSVVVLIRRAGLLAGSAVGRRGN